MVVKVFDDATQILGPIGGAVAVGVGDVGGFIALVMSAIPGVLTFAAEGVPTVHRAVFEVELACILEFAASTAAFLTPLFIHAIV